MQYNQLGSSPLKVSNVCLGTMTFGEQNTQADANQQLDYAIANGVNFLDTAELYAIPPRKETYGATERMIGHWLNNNRGKRADIILATKIAGQGMSWIRGGDRILGKYIETSVDASLKRLQTDYIDLYQLHWPNRPNPHFNRHWFGDIDFTEVDVAQEEAEMLAVLEALDKCVKAGKIRYCGLSNETSWGIEKYIQLSKTHQLPRMVSIQNEFSLIQSKDWPSVAESCALNEMAYLPWSPLGSGVLSGKYLNDQRPAGSRWTLTDRHGNFRNQPQVHEAVAAYKAIAEKHGMTASQLSLAWCHQFKWVTSTIIGATKMEQLKENLAAFEMELSEEILQEVYAVKQRYYVPFI
jgi:aryl-alcohol dehydrogenase-like predicted oxidoreductase